MFLTSSLFDICIVEVKWNAEWFFNLTREDHFLRLFSWVRVETHFHWEAQSLIFFNSLLRLFVKVFKLWFTAKDTCHQYLGFDDKSLMQMRINKGRKIEPWGSPAVILAQDECCPISTTLCFLESEKSFIIFKSFPVIPFILVCKSSVHIKL